MKTVRIGDRLCFESGEGMKTLVFFHGWAGNHTVWDYLVPLLEKNYRCVTVDLFNHYEGNAIDEVQGVNFGAFYSQKVFEIIEHYSATSAVIPVFWSLSTLLYLELVRAERRVPIEKAVSLSGTCRFCDEEGEMGFHPTVLRKFRRELERNYPDSVDELFGRYFIASDSPPHFGQYRGVPRRESLLDQLDYLANTDLTDTVVNVPAQLIVVHGSNDMVISAGMALFISEKHPNSILKVIEKGSHSLMLDTPKELAEILNTLI